MQDKINIVIDTNQAKIDSQCLQEIIDLIVINPSKAEIEQILEDYGVLYHSSN
ncbi:hypothetical protein [Vallitalea guaymasensis]|uniref:hypothetical protein n=1 Tax=Vallitalea guaymasensis TaxID=1185412 RepID=UPI002354A412|nr:hypothetical protein [Vallitalea guaymasensis]